MKAIVAAALVLATMISTFAMAQPASAEEEIRERLRQWDNAYKNRDVRTLGQLLADQFTLIDATGAVLTKQQYLMSVIKSPDVAIPISYASVDVRIQIDGNEAVVTGRSAVKGRGRGAAQTVAGDYRFTDRWVKQHGVWRPVATRAAPDH